MSDFHTERQLHYLAKLTELTYTGDLENLPTGHDIGGEWFSEPRSGFLKNISIFVTFVRSNRM